MMFGVCFAPLARHPRQNLGSVLSNRRCLAALTGASNARTESKQVTVMRAGAAIYKDSCTACHRGAGTGHAFLFPRLAGSAFVQSDDPLPRWSGWC